MVATPVIPSVVLVYWMSLFLVVLDEVVVDLVVVLLAVDLEAEADSVVDSAAADSLAAEVVVVGSSIKITFLQDSISNKKSYISVAFFILISNQLEGFDFFVFAF